MSKSLAAVLLACLLVLSLPSLAIAGGCDDPGNVGACTNKPHSSMHAPQPPPNPPGTSLAQHSPSGSQSKFDFPGWRAWLITMLVGLGR